jgi:hypothetical protein
MISVGKSLVTIKTLARLESTIAILEILFGETLKTAAVCAGSNSPIWVAALHSLCGVGVTVLIGSRCH